MGRAPRQRAVPAPLTEVADTAEDHHAVAAVARRDPREVRARFPVQVLHQQVAAAVAPAAVAPADQQVDDHRSVRVVVVATAKNCSR